MTVRLHPQQLDASEPRGHRWVAASAGTGKTQVLSARVFRLLLAGARPESILCLTFTRAGAAEMQERVNGRLARWVRLNDGALGAELRAMGEAADPDTLAAARRLFARVLDAGGGGLQVQTIHGFCQSLLASFPLESGIAPGFEVIGDDQRLALADRTLTALLMDDGGTLAARVGALSVRLGEAGARAFLLRCAGSVRLLERLPEALSDWLRGAAGSSAPVGETIRLSMAEFPVVTLTTYAAAVRACGGRDADAHCDAMDRWAALDPDGRFERLDLLSEALLTKAGTPRGISRLIKREPDAEMWQAELCDAVGDVRGVVALSAYLDELAEALEAGRAFALAFDTAKRREGLVDYDDLIAGAGDLLSQSSMADWVRYKLDERIDHILVDEAQDTNAEQWRVVEALAAEFFAGRTDPDAPLTRTLFSVGDFKQAIFGFQGTDPAAFAAARQRFGTEAVRVAAPFDDVALTRSFRSTPAILRLVDAVVARLGTDAMGLEGSAAIHESATGGPGEVILARPVTTEERGGDEEDEGWLDDADRALAVAIARQVRDWIDRGETVGNPPRPITAGDIMVLVRARGPYVPLLVARLHEEGVPVAGVDRLFLSAPLVVQDLLAAIRWVLQPQDDLALACLLVSPLFGWTQDELTERTDRKDGVSLWRHLRDTRGEAELAPLRDLLARADYAPPYEFLERILSGPMGGRAKLLARLGEDALDPLEELMNAALTFEATEPPGLQRFLHWIERSESEIKRELAGAPDAVRVLTVHGAKGLEAPVVILADATKDPNAGWRPHFEWRLRDDVRLPALPPRGAERSGALADAMEANAKRDAAEHQRLLYVALTRARERLLVVGKAPSRGGLSPHSWHAAVADGLDELGVDEEDDPLWVRVRRFADVTAWSMKGQGQGGGSIQAIAEAPDWLRRSAPPEARPPRPLAPSRLGEDDAAARPLGLARAEAIERGVLLHALFERLPPVAAERRREVGRRWLLSRSGMDADRAATLLDAALDLIERPEWARLWGPDALAEAPLSAVVDGEVVAGTVDRLMVTDAAVEVVDFKTGLAIPDRLDAVPALYGRQMAAYRDALRVLFPGRPVHAALLYSAGPRWIDLPDDWLDRHKPGWGGDNKA